MPYSTDTRTLQPGDTYVAIRGETHDGHDFIPKAIENGATAIVTEVDVDVPAHVEVIRVERSLDYLIEQARAKVRRINPDIVAITGSMGKTSTKMAVLAVLREAFEVVASEGNKNTPLGLSLLLLNHDFTADTKLVLEMGARIPGDLHELCSYFPPTVSVITVVRGVHIETLGSIDGVQREKAAIVRALGPDGTACLNGDDPRVLAMRDVNAGRTITYGRDPACDVRPDRITATLPMLGEHAVSTALAAFAAGLAFGMSDADINRGLSRIETEKGRLNRLTGRNGSTLIDDTYNASPDATLAALRVLAGQDGTRRIAFLGDMLELGETEVEQHAEVLTSAIESADTVHAVGSIMARAADTLSPEQRAHITLHPTSKDLAASLRGGQIFEPEADDVILVKGSQGTRMERISEALLHPDLSAEDVLPRQSESWKQIA
jgi:UDP-N-acetylmuramoyl-tripeptide--D-alanyl-D-alanine ligase